MGTPASSSQLLLKSFGHGIFQARTVPPERSSDGADRLRERVLGSGLPVQEVVPDPDDPEAAYILVREGRPPCELELRQWGPSDFGRLAAAVEESGSGRFRRRVAMLGSPGMPAVEIVGEHGS
jgi:hypothetical protein